MSNSLGGLSRTLRGDLAVASASAPSAPPAPANAASSKKARTLPTVDVSSSACSGATPAVLRRLRMLNLVMGLVHSSLAAATAVAGNLSLAAPIYATNIHFEDDDPTSGLAYDLLPSYTRLGTLPLTWITAAFFLCSAVGHLGNATLWRAFYEEQLAQCIVPTRWIEYQVSAPLMFFLIAYASGVREYTLLVSLVGLVASTIPFGWITEVVARPAGGALAGGGDGLDRWDAPASTRLAVHLAGYIPQTVAWGALLAGFYDETDGDGAPAFVHAIVWSQLALFWSFGFVQLAQQLSVPKCYYRGEYAYQFLSLGAKATLGGILLANVIMLDDADEAFGVKGSDASSGSGMA